MIGAACSHDRDRDNFVNELVVRDPVVGHSAGSSLGDPPLRLPQGATGMRSIPGGTFVMDTTEMHSGETVSVHPRASVTIAPFQLDATEVTAGAYIACVQAGTCAATRTADHDDPLCNVSRPGRELFPMNCVTWTEADAYCQAQGKRLPSEQEWEYVARHGTDSARFPWGNEEPMNQLCWAGAQHPDRDGSCRVASFPAEAFGLYDLAGNVGEWTATSEPLLAPKGEPGRVARGGSWASNAAHGILLHRVEWVRLHDGATGFRCAR